MCKNNKEKWQELIGYAESRILETKNPKQQERFRLSLRVIKRMMEHGEPFPSEPKRSQSTAA